MQVKTSLHIILKNSKSFEDPFTLQFTNIKDIFLEKIYNISITIFSVYLLLLIDSQDELQIEREFFFGSCLLAELSSRNKASENVR